MILALWKKNQDAAGKDAGTVKALQNLMMSDGSVGMDSLRRATASVVEVTAGADVSNSIGNEGTCKRFCGQMALPEVFEICFIGRR